MAAFPPLEWPAALNRSLRDEGTDLMPKSAKSGARTAIGDSGSDVAHVLIEVKGLYALDIMMPGCVAS